MNAPTKIVRDIYSDFTAEHFPKNDTPTHYGTIEYRISRAGGSKKRVPRYSLALRTRSEVVSL